MHIENWEMLDNQALEEDVKGYCKLIAFAKCSLNILNTGSCSYPPTWGYCDTSSINLSISLCW